MNRSFAALLTFVLLGLGACESKDSNGVDFGTDSTEYSYSFTYNGCPTGEQKFSTLSQMCDGLKDDSLNKSCASTLRETYFKEKGCAGSFRPVVAKPPETRNPPANNLPSDPATDPAEELAKETFLLNYASGVKSWTVKDVAVQIVVKDKFHHVLHTKDLICSTASPIKLEGKYPTLVFQLGWMTCDTAETIPELLYLNIIGSRLTYRVKHIPVSDIAPNQFRLLLKDADIHSISRKFQWSDVQSINANSKADTVFIDFMGRKSLTGVDDLDRGTLYFFEATVSKNEQERPVLKINLSGDNHRTKEFSEMTMVIE